MNISKLPAILLRFGLSFVLLYAAVASLVSPANWVGYLPDVIIASGFESSVLIAWSLIEIILAVWILSGWRVRYAATVVGFALLLMVAVNNQQMNVVFRDIGLAFATFALALMSAADNSGSSESSTATFPNI